MSDQIVCPNCSNMIPNDTNLSQEERTPCPKCGSRGRIHNLELSTSAGASSTFSAVVIPYTQRLLETAESLVERKEYSVAVVTAHMACELAAELAFARAFTARKIQELADPVMDLLPSNNLGNERVRKLFDALAGGELATKPFWIAFKASSERRNKAVHHGGSLSEQEARDSIAAAKQLIAHVNTIAP